MEAIKKAAPGKSTIANTVRSAAYTATGHASTRQTSNQSLNHVLIPKSSTPVKQPQKMTL